MRYVSSEHTACKRNQSIYQAVVIAKLTYASSAWWGFTTATDRQRLELSFDEAFDPDYHDHPPTSYLWLKL